MENQNQDPNLQPEVGPLVAEAVQTPPPQVQVHIDPQPQPPSPDVQPPVGGGMDPDKKKLIKKVAIGLAVVALGVAAYFLSGSGLFKGQLELKTDEEIANENLALLEGAIDIVDDNAEFSAWPPKAGSKLAFEVSEDADIRLGLDPDTGSAIWLRADFEYFVDKGKIVVTNASTAALLEMRKICADFPGDDEGEICTNNLNEPLSHVYEEVGDYVVVFSVYDSNNRKDSISKTITVDQVGPAEAPDFTTREFEPLRIQFEVPGIEALLAEYGNVDDWCFEYGDAKPDSPSRFCQSADDIRDELIVKHTYEAEKEYEVILKLYDPNDELVASRSKVIAVTGVAVPEPEEPEEVDEAEAGELVPSLRTEVTKLDNEYMVTVYDTSENMQDVGYTVLNCDLARGGRSYSFYFVEEDEVIAGQRFATPAEDIVTNGKACYFGNEGEYTLTYEYLNAEGIRFQTTTETFNFPLEEQGEPGRFWPQVEISPEVNGVVTVRDLTEDEEGRVTKTRLYCGTSNEEFVSYVDPNAVAEGLLAMEDAYQIEKVKTEGFECLYGRNGEYTIRYEQFAGEEGIGVSEMSVVISHAGRDADGNPVVEGEAEPEAEGPALVANIEVAKLEAKAVMVRDISENVESVDHSSLDCGNGVDPTVYFGTRGRDDDYAYDYVSGIRQDGYRCEYPNSGTFTISYDLYDINNALIGHDENSVTVSTEFSFTNSSVGADRGSPLPDLVPNLVLSELEGGMGVKVVDESLNKEGVDRMTLDCGDGNGLMGVARIDSSDIDLDKFLAEGYECSYEGKPDGQYTITYTLLNAGGIPVGRDIEQVTIETSLLLSFLHGLENSLDDSLYTAALKFDALKDVDSLQDKKISKEMLAPVQNAKTMPAGATVYVDFACSTERSYFTIVGKASDGGEPNTVNIPIIPAESCSVANEAPVTPPETEPADEPADEPAQTSSSSGSSGGGGGGTSSRPTWKAVCDISEVNPVVGQTVAFNASDSTGRFTLGSWNFDDGEGSLYEFDVRKNDPVDVEYIFETPGVREVVLTIGNGSQKSQCKQKINVEAAGPAQACSDGQDNDEDGFTDLDDPGCDSTDDQDEGNGFARSTPECNDNVDNDGDGFTDLTDIGCQNAFDNSEGNPRDAILPGGDTAQQVCLKKSDKKVSFVDVDDSFASDLIMDFATSFYDGTDAGLKGDVLLKGYQMSSGYEFKGDQPIRRDEALKLLSLASCLSDESKVENSTTPVAYKDAEFSIPDYWAREVVYRAANNGLIKKATYMNPGSNVTRGEFAKMLANVDKQLRGTETERCEKGEQLAGDLDFTHWSCSYFKTLNKLGIAEVIEDGKGNTRLYPNEMLDRTSAIVWLNNYIAVINN